MSTNPNNDGLNNIQQPIMERDVDIAITNAPLNSGDSDGAIRARNGDITGGLTNTLTQMITNQLRDDLPSDDDSGYSRNEDGASTIARGNLNDVTAFFHQLFQNQFGVIASSDNNDSTGIETFFDSGTDLSNNKKATENAVNHLKHVNVHELEDKNCSICYELFSYDNNDDEDDDDENDDKKSKNKNLVEKRFEPLDNDPTISFPTDATGKKYSQFKRPLILADDEHIPVQMPCKHIFGKSCLIEWLKNHSSCPLCRKEVESHPVTGKEKVQIIPRRFVPADWSNPELTSEDPSVPIPNGRTTGFSTTFNGSDGNTIAFQIVNNLVGRYMNE